jgi:flagellar hook-length control protein FliK
VYSVTTEVSASVSLQAALPKAPRSDPSQGTDTFGALVDSSTPVSSGRDRPGPAAEQPSSQRRSGDTAASADSTRSRDAAAADQKTKDASNDRQADAGQASDGNVKADANDDASQKAKVKSSGSKSDDEKENAAAKPASDTPVESDPALALQIGAPVTMPTPVAVVIPVANAPAETPAATAAPGSATAPLAIAAAAIAASAQATAPPLASPAQIKIDSAPAAATPSVTDTSSQVAGNIPAATATAQIAVPARATAAAAVATPAPQETATPIISAAAAAVAVEAVAPVQPKITPLKELAATPAKTPASGAPAATPGPADPSVTVTPTGTSPSSNVAQPPSGVAKQDTGTGIVDIEKADAGSASTATAATPADDRSPVVSAAHALTAPSDPGAQTNATIQPPLPATTAPASPVLAPLTVTPAINAPVPMSGLALEIAASARSGKSRFEIRLDPADLGRIDVRIDVDRNGQVTSHLRVEKPETLSMLRQDAPHLQRALDDAGFKTGNGGLQFSLRDQSSSGQNSGNETGRNAQRLVVSDEDTIPAAIAGRTYGRVLGSSSGVDISV